MLLTSQRATFGRAFCLAVTHFWTGPWLNYSGQQLYIRFLSGMPLYLFYPVCLSQKATELNAIDKFTVAKRKLRRIDHC